MTRYDILTKLVPLLKSESLVLCNIGIPSQELFSLGDKPNYFYMLGSMGMVSSIGLGLSLATRKKVIVIDGDGSVLMNLGTLVTIANQKPKNLVLIIIDNGVYGSTGNQPTYTKKYTSLAKIAQGAGIKNVFELRGDKIDTYCLKELIGKHGPVVLVVKVKPGNAKVKIIPFSGEAIKIRFMEKAKN